VYTFNVYVKLTAEEHLIAVTITDMYSSPLY